jgi:hypothetical protein
MINVYNNIEIDDFILKIISKKRDEFDIKNSPKGFYQFIGLVENNRKKIENWFFKNTGSKIKTFSSWVNYTTYKDIDNGFEWHEDKHGTILNYTKEQNDKQMLERPMEGKYTSVVWVDGTSGQGGSLNIMTDDGIEFIDFKKNTIITFPIDAYHKVEKYYSEDYRISMIFTFDYV